MAVEFSYTDLELSGLACNDIISAFSAIDKVEWCIKYSQKAAHRQLSIVRLYIAGTTSTGVSGFDIDIPTGTITDMETEMGALATRIDYCQGIIQNNL